MGLTVFFFGLKQMPLSTFLCLCGSLNHLEQMITYALEHSCVVFSFKQTCFVSYFLVLSS